MQKTSPCTKNDTPDETNGARSAPVSLVNDWIVCKALPCSILYMAIYGWTVSRCFTVGPTTSFFGIGLGVGLCMLRLSTVFYMLVCRMS